MADPTRPKSNRRRYNAPKVLEGWTALPASGRRGRPPACLVPLSDEGKKLWARWWASPMATQWSDTDIPGLSRLANLYESVFDGSGLNQAQTSQIDRLEKSFGLTPEGRKSLKWQVVAEEDVEAAPASSDDRFAHLKVVHEAG